MSIDAPALEAFRAREGLTQRGLADLLGVSPVTVSNWERGRSQPRTSALAKLNTLIAGSPDAVARPSGDDVWGVDGLELVPAPYVLNGPQDQRNFHRRLLEFQVAGLASTEEADPRSLSLAALVREGDSWRSTFQSRLEDVEDSALAWRGTYGLHGLHRYVGRFPPHVIRALLVGFGLRRDALVLDPFLGSGTTTLEARLLGYRSHGIEINPLSALISRCKSEFPESTDSIRTLMKELDGFYRTRFDTFVRERGRDFPAAAVLERSGNLIEPFANYEKWFSPDALLGTSIVLEFARTLAGFERDLVHVALSAQMRSIGNVDVDVVRAEYRKAPRVGVDTLRLVVRALRKAEVAIRESIESHHEVIAPARSVTIEQGSLLGDCGPEDGSVDCIITSPPYGVESLSYLRTHLLSYRVLSKELGMDAYDWNDGAIGSEYLGGPDVVPEELRVAEESATFREFFDGSLVELSGADFKRVAMMVQFFEDMSAVGDRIARWLAPGGRLAFVIGNKSLLGRIIPTDKIMSEVFEAKGLRLDGSMTHKLKTNNSNSSVPWQDRIIAEENIMLATKR